MITGNKEIVELLIQYGANVMDPNVYWRLGPISEAVKRGDTV